MLNIPYPDIYRPEEGENLISFVAPLVGPNYVMFSMHWTKTEEGRLRPYVCPTYFGIRGCPICDQASKTQDPQERREFSPKNRVLLNVWNMRGQSVPLLWDVSYWLLRNALEEGIANPRLWDPSKAGEAVSLRMKRRGPGFPEYTSVLRPRNIDIPRPIRTSAFDLRSILKNANMVPGEYKGGVLATDGAEKLLLKDKVAQIVGEKKPAFERKVRRKIIMD